MTFSEKNIFAIFTLGVIQDLRRDKYQILYVVYTLEIRTLWFIISTVFYDSKPSL